MISMFFNIQYEIQIIKETPHKKSSITMKHCYIPVSRVKHIMNRLGLCLSFQGSDLHSSALVFLRTGVIEAIQVPLTAIVQLINVR